MATTSIKMPPIINTTVNQTPTLVLIGFHLIHNTIISIMTSVNSVITCIHGTFDFAAHFGLTASGLTINVGPIEPCGGGAPPLIAVSFVESTHINGTDEASIENSRECVEEIIETETKCRMRVQTMSENSEASSAHGLRRVIECVWSNIRMKIVVPVPTNGERE